MTDNVEQKLGYIGARLREKSTYAGLAGAIGIGLALYHGDIKIDPTALAGALESIGIGIGVLMSIFLPEKSADTTVKMLIAALALSLFYPASPARAGDIAAPSLTAINKALTAGYPTKCGAYYGIGTGGNAGAVSGGAVGTQIVQGDLDLIVGYTCPFAQNAFWFAEAQGGFSNLNGQSNGLSLSGPGVFIERVGVGSPIQQYLSAILPNLNLPAVPALPSTPGATPGTPASYGFAGLVEQDFGAQVGATSGHNWILAPIIGVGLLTRYSNNMVVDTWAGWQMNATNSVCFGGGCVKPGNMARIGVSLKY